MVPEPMGRVSRNPEALGNLFALAPNDVHRTLGVSDDPGGVGSDQVIGQFRMVRGHDDQAGPDLVGHVENLAVDAVMADGLTDVAIVREILI